MAALGEEGDISNICNFQWFEWCDFMDQGELFPMQKEALGKVLGPAKNCGNEMAQWILKSNSKIFPRRPLRHLRTEDLKNNLVEERKHLTFMENIRVNLGDSMSLPIKPFSEDEVEYTPYEDEDGAPHSIPENEAVDAAGKPLFQQSVMDILIQAEVLLPHIS